MAHYQSNTDHSRTDRPTPQRHGSTNLAQIKKSHTHVLLMTFGFSCTNCALYKSGAFLNRKIPVTKHAELGGHITLYIFILTSYSFSFHAHSSNGLLKHFTSRINPSPNQPRPRLGCRTPDTILTFLCTSPVTYKV